MPADMTTDHNGPSWKRAISVILAVGCWVALATTAAALTATLAGRTIDPTHAVFQMAMPFVVLGVSTVLLFAALTRRRALSATSGIVLVATVLLTMPALWPRSHPEPADDDLSVFVANIRYNNAVPDEKAAQILAADDDLLVLIELTPGFLDRLEAAGIDDRYPYKVTHPLDGAHGAGIYSKRPVADARLEPIGNLVAPAVTVSTPTGEIRVVAVHTRPPIGAEYVPVWTQDLEALDRYASQLHQPTVLAGDFNATRWHPLFHDILDEGLTDAHEQVGRGITYSWPSDGRIGQVVGPFSRLDHAVLFEADATAVVDGSAAGSDHIPFVLKVRPNPADTLTP